MDLCERRAGVGREGARDIRFFVMPDSQRDPRNLYLINNGENIGLFSRVKVFISGNSYIISSSRNTLVTLKRNAIKKITRFQNKKTLINNSY